MPPSPRGWQLPLVSPARAPRPRHRRQHHALVRDVYEHRSTEANGGPTPDFVAPADPEQPRARGLRDRRVARSARAAAQDPFVRRLPPRRAVVDAQLRGTRLPDADPERDDANDDA